MKAISDNSAILNRHTRQLLPHKLRAECRLSIGSATIAFSHINDWRRDQHLLSQRCRLR
jgi:hypothetical protein